MPERVALTVRRALLFIAGSEALYLFAAFCAESVLEMDPLMWHREAIDMLTSLFVVPWGPALCLLALERRTRMERSGIRADLAVLFGLLVWIVVPFALRFGLTFNTAYSWYNHLVLFFGVYALVTQADTPRLDQAIDWAAALFAGLSFALGIPTLRAAMLGSAVGVQLNGYGLGLDGSNFLSFGLHYNITGMIAVCCALFSLAGFCRRKNPVAKLFHLAAFALMALCVVLSQSRTSRYALLLAGFAGCYGLASTRLPIQRALTRNAAALCCSLVLLFSGYAGARALTNAALSHYARVQALTLAQADDAAEALAGADALDDADGEDDADEQYAEGEESDADAQDVTVKTSRPAIDATFSDRTQIWQNLFDLWKREPKRFIIGSGMGNTGNLIVQGTIHEANGSVAVHNSYLQFIADYGIIGFALLCAFLVMQVPGAIRVLLSQNAHPGDRVFVMLAASQLLTALMESQPLGAMSASSLALFFSLAVIRARDASLRGSMPQ